MERKNNRIRKNPALYMISLSPRFSMGVNRAPRSVLNTFLITAQTEEGLFFCQD